jgi:hypothetical protein
MGSPALAAKENKSNVRSSNEVVVGSKCPRFSYEIGQQDKLIVKEAQSLHYVLSLAGHSSLGVRRRLTLRNEPPIATRRHCTLEKRATKRPPACVSMVRDVASLLNGGIDRYRPFRICALLSAFRQTHQKRAFYRETVLLSRICSSHSTFIARLSTSQIRSQHLLVPSDRCSNAPIANSLTGTNAGYRLSPTLRGLGVRTWAKSIHQKKT